MNMELKDSKKAYKAPVTRLVEMKSQCVLCQSNHELTNTQKFGMSGTSYDDNDWE